MLRKSLWVPRQQPTCPVDVDWSNPLTHKISDLVIPDYSAGGYRRLVGNKPLTYVSGIDKLCSSIGMGARQTAGNYVYAVNTVTAAPVTVSIVYVPTSIAATKGIFSFGASSIDGTPRLIIQQNNADIKVYFAGAYQITATAALVVNKPIYISFTHDGTTGKLFVNGKLSGSFVGAFTAGNITNWYLGTGYNGQALGIYHLGAIWSRAFSPSEVLALYNNPYQILRPKTRRVWVPVMDGGTTFYQNILASESSVALYLKQTNKPVSSSATSTSNFVKNISNFLSASASSLVSSSKQLGVSLVSSAGNAASITKNVLKTITSSVVNSTILSNLKNFVMSLSSQSNVVTSLFKLVSKYLSLSSTTSAVVSKLKVILLILLAASTSVTTILKSASKQVFATSTTIVTLSKLFNISLLLAAVASASSSVSTATTRLLALITTSVTSGNLQVTKVILQMLNAASSSVIDISRYINKQVSVLSTSSVSVLKSITKSVSATSSTTASLFKTVILSIGATASSLLYLLAYSLGIVSTIRNIVYATALFQKTKSVISTFTKSKNCDTSFTINSNKDTNF